LLSEARRLGVKLLPIDVNKSTAEYRVETTTRKTLDPSESVTGVRMALTDVQSISEAEVARIIAEQPFENIGDFYLRAKPTRRTLESLALIGGLDSLASDATRGDVLARVRQLNAVKTRPPSEANQPTLDFSVREQMPSGNAEMTTAEKVSNELAVLKMDVSEHILEMYRPMLDEMGVLRSDELVSLRSKTDILVAGIRVATQTPPMRSGKRVVFITLDDGAGCSDSTFFDEAQSRCSHILFNNRLLLIAGKTRRTGVRGVSIMAENAWDLRELWSQWQQKKKPLAS
jgi:error-prone DNA polymerase